MDNYKDLEEANKEIEKSKVVFHDAENSTEKGEDELSEAGEDQDETKEEGSGIFTTDGKELPQIEGGYDLIDPGGSLGDDDLVSV